MIHKTDSKTKHDDETEREEEGPGAAEGFKVITRYDSSQLLRTRQIGQVNL